MALDFGSENSLSQELAVGALLDDICGFLNQKRPNGEMQRMDQEIAEVIEPEEYAQFARYKQFCLQELGKINQTPGANGAIHSAIERGFILGYWFSMQHFKTQ